jgi:uncharacterized protein YecE (DUF72 family)
MQRGRLYVGTSGWSYSHWAKGRFYPRGLRSNEWLRYFAERFNTVEINASYYRLPKLEMVERWRTQVPGRFRFAVKLWKRITHQKRLSECADDLAAFLDTAAGLGTRRGPLLVQLPPSLHCDAALLRGFLGDLKRAIGRKRWRVTFEFRHASWITPPIIGVLDEFGHALCLADMPRCPITRPGNAEFVYVRRHGPEGTYGGCYSSRHIKADARQVAEWLNLGRDVFCYYNNDMDGHALDNARQLRRQVDKLCPA